MTTLMLALLLVLSSYTVHTAGYLTILRRDSIKSAIVRFTGLTS